jgi:hypothetical protein
MSYGMEIYAADGTLQANSEMLCWFCRKTGTGTTLVKGLGLGNTTPSKIEVDVTGITNPVVAIRMNGYTVARAGGYGIFTSDAPVGTSYIYYIFDFSASLPASNDYGLEMFNAAGQRTFNSSYFPMQVLNMLTGSSNTSIFEAATHTGKALAIASSVMGGYRTAGDLYCYDTGGPTIGGGGPGEFCNDLKYQNDHKLYGGALSNSSQTVTTANVSYDDVLVSAGNSNSYFIPPNWNIPTKILVIDVTNIPIGVTFY